MIHWKERSGRNKQIIKSLRQGWQGRIRNHEIEMEEEEAKRHGWIEIERDSVKNNFLSKSEMQLGEIAGGVLVGWLRKNQFWKKITQQFILFISENCHLKDKRWIYFWLRVTIIISWPSFSLWCRSGRRGWFYHLLYKANHPGIRTTQSNLDKRFFLGFCSFRTLFFTLLFFVRHRLFILLRRLKPVHEERKDSGRKCIFFNGSRCSCCFYFLRIDRQTVLDERGRPWRIRLDRSVFSLLLGNCI